MRRFAFLAAVITLAVSMAQTAGAVPVYRQMYFSRTVNHDDLRHLPFPIQPLGCSRRRHDGLVRGEGHKLTTTTLEHLMASVNPFENGTGNFPVDFSQQLWVQVDRLKRAVGRT